MQYEYAITRVLRPECRESLLNLHELHTFMTMNTDTCACAYSVHKNHNKLVTIHARNRVIFLLTFNNIVVL